jgi:hypothetical protein
MPEPRLSEDQFEALRWVGRNRSTKSEWTTNGKTAKGGPENWTHMRISGPSGSILVAKADLRALKDLMVCGPLKGPDASIHAVSEAGKSVLARGYQPSSISEGGEE